MRRLLLIALVLLVGLGGCEKDCGKYHQLTANRMKGTWDVVEVITDSATYTNTGEQFTFRKCTGTFTRCEGIFTTVDGKEESFHWSMKAGTFNITDFDWKTDKVAKYNNHMQWIEVCTRKELVFNPQVNPLTLEKAK